MKSALLIILAFIVISRFWLLYHDRRLSWWKAGLLGIVQAAAVLVTLRFSWLVVLIALGMLAINMLEALCEWLFETKSSPGNSLPLNATQYGCRALSFLAVAFLLSVALSKGYAPPLYGWVAGLGRWLNTHVAFIPAAGQLKLQKQYALEAIGLLLAGSETNHVLRAILKRIDITQSDPTEYNKGRTIGVFERWLIFILVLLRSYEAIGFILTAKGLVRFKKLDEPGFAEYFLIGTLLSVVFPIIIALFVRVLLPGV
jgi:hypothetical protein